jgi:bleomycin hydrolase
VGRLVTTDDHGMHTVGLAEDEKGNTYFYTKNSWGFYGPYKGYHYISENYLRAKCNAITIHKDALTDEMKAKLGIK